MSIATHRDVVPQTLRGTSLIGRAGVQVRNGDGVVVPWIVTLVPVLNIDLIHATVALVPEDWRSVGRRVAVWIGANEVETTELATAPIEGVAGGLRTHELQARFVSAAAEGCK